jgi:imidazolonepropionase-like amidohydrolase
MRCRVFVVIVVAVVTALPALRAARQSTAPASVTVFEGALLFSGDGSAPLANAAFLVDEGAIRRIGRRGEISVPAGAARVDLSGTVVMPTLVNTHGHPGFQKGLAFSRDNYTRENVLDDLHRAAYFGVGVVMAQGIDPGEIVYEIRRDQARGAVGGARLLTAGRGIGAPNAGPGAAAFQGVAYEVTNPDQGRAAVRELAAKTVDIVKIWVDDRGGRAPRLAPPVYRAIIEEAHRHGLKVNAHVFYHDDAVDLVEAGIDGFAHLVRDREMDAALIAAIVRRGVYVMPNLSGTERGIHAGLPPWFEEAGLAALLRESVSAPVIARMRASFTAREPRAAAVARERYAILQRSLRKLSAAGARIILGSDTGLEDHLFGHAEQRELEAMAGAGMTPAEVIVAATSRSAEYLGLRDTGTLTPGKRADFLVLGANPIDDIRHTRRLEAVYLNGQAVDRAAIRARIN